MIRLSEEKPGLALRPGIASQIGDWRIEAREVEEEGAQLANVLLFMPSLGETIFSRRGSITSDSASHTKTIILEQGLLLVNDEKRASLLRFDRLETVLPELKAAKGIPVDIYSTMSLTKLFEGPEAGSDARIARRMLIEIHRRIALGAATLPFALLALGLALGRRNLSRASGTVMGLIGAISYYALVQLSEGILRDQRVPIVLAIWLPNLVLICVASVLIFRAGRSASASNRGSGRNTESLLERTGLVASGPRMKRWALPRYVGSQFARMVFACVFGLVLAYFIIDLFDNLKWFNQYGATAAEIGRYYGARLPVLAARIVPMALLIAVALTISLLGANGELLGMRACGIPVFRVLAPVWLICGLAVPVDHLLANEIVPRASEEASRLKQTEIKNREFEPNATRERVWYRVGSRIHEIGKLELLRGQASAITLYDLDENGLPVKRTDADSAIHFGQGSWLLTNPRAVELDGRGLRRDPAPKRLVKFDKETPTEVDMAHLTPDQLRSRIADLNLEGPLEATYRTALQMKIAAPLACLLLPLIVLFFAATGPPFPRPVHTLIASTAIAVGHALATSTAGAMGQGGTIEPWLAGWSPSILFGAIALIMGIRLRLRLSHGG